MTNARIELCWDCHEPLGGDYIVYLPPHHQILGGGRRNAHGGCVPDSATVVRHVTVEDVR